MRFLRFLTALALLSVCLSCCDLGPDSRQLGGGYRLKRVGEQGQFALIIPHESGGMIIDEIGWSQPLIIVRASGSQYWDVIDTSHAQRIEVSDTERRSNETYQKVV